MTDEIITIKENSFEKELSFVPSTDDEDYLHSELFNRGFRGSIRITYDRHKNAKISVGPYAGIIQLSKKRIHFSTKVNTRLFFMLSFLKSEDEFLYDPNTPIEIKEGVNFFDVIGRLFLKELEKILKKGLLKKYVRTAENTRYLKGKLLIKKQINCNLINKSRFFCEYEDLTFDNVENQVVLNALISLISLIKFNINLKNDLKRLEVILKDFITLAKIDPRECDKINFNRINEYYSEIIKLSKLILQERFIRSVYKGKSRGFNFIVNMNKVFEDFITEIIEEIISCDPKFGNFEIEKQPRFNRLVEEKSIIIKPDIVLRYKKSQYPLVIDTKYKMDTVNADYYQVIAYSLALRDCKACCLIYPKSDKFENNKSNNESLTLVRDLTGKDSEKVKIYARAIDLYLEDNELNNYEVYVDKIKTQVKDLLENLIEIHGLELIENEKQMVNVVS